MKSELSDHENTRPLIAHVLEGDVDARKTLSQQMDPVVQFQTDRFCRRFCHQNKFYHQCTLTPPEGAKHSDAPLCDWANASYSWMLSDLTNENRLRKFQGKHETPFLHYARVVINSLPFYERWKDWRFGRRVHVPEFVIDLHEHAKRIFLALRSGDDVALIASKLSLDEQLVYQTAEQILLTLIKRQKLHLLDPPTTTNFSELETEHDEGPDFASHQPSQEHLIANAEMTAAFQKLDSIEQFVLEAMVIELQDADDVLNALAQLDLSIKKGVSAADTNKQQLYYFKRKCIAKLERLLHGGQEE